MKPTLTEPSSTRAVVTFEHMEGGAVPVTIRATESLRKVPFTMGELTGYVVMTQTPAVKVNDDGIGVEVDLYMVFDVEPTLASVLGTFYGA